MASEVFVPPHSSHVNEVEWDDESEDLIVTWDSGDRTKYLNVPRATYRALTQAGSVGAFIARQIKDRFMFDPA